MPRDVEHVAMLDRALTWPLVGIVILNWKRPRDVVTCVNALRRIDYPAYQVVVVDNSGDPSAVALIREQSQGVTVIENGRNLGFAGGCNVGIAELLARGAEYVLLLNDDAIISADAIQRLVDVAESDPHIGILGPKIYYADPPDVIWSAGGAIDAHGQARHLRVNEQDEQADELVRDVDYATGCVLLVKRAVIAAVGPLDERFFAYFEEAELCARARRYGFRVVYVPSAHAWHNIEMVERERSSLYLYLMARNRLLYLRCGGASPLLLVEATFDILRTAAAWRLRPRHRAMRPYAGVLLRGVGDFLRGHFGPPRLVA